MKFPYIKLPFFDPKLKWVSRPYIPIRLTGPKGVWEGYGLIDSGADRCLFSIQIAEKIGLDLKGGKIQDFGGIEGGALEAKLSNTELQVMGMVETIKILAGFIDSPGVSAILGQDGFFDNFRIKFEKDHGIVEVSPVK